MTKNDSKPVIIKKITYDEDCAHGGAWKIAFADLMTAVMAFFMLLWVLSGINEEDKKIIAEFFKDPTVFEGRKDQFVPEKNQGLTNSVIDNGGMQDNPKSREGDKPLNEESQTNIDSLMLQISENLVSKNGIKVEKTEDGIDVTMYDEAGKSFFNVGSAVISDDAILVLDKLSQVMINAKDISISIVGHTDALKYKKEDYDNFDLSIDRAQAIRRSLIELGISVEQFDLITGKADRELIKEDGVSPYSAKQRRVVLSIRKK